MLISLEGDRKKERKTRKAAKKRKNDEIEKKLAAREKENPMDMSKERAIKKIKQAGEKVWDSIDFVCYFSSYSLECYFCQYQQQFREHEVFELESVLQQDGAVKVRGFSQGEAEERKTVSETVEQSEQLQAVIFSSSAFCFVRLVLTNMLCGRESSIFEFLVLYFMRIFGNYVRNISQLTSV